MDPLAIITGIFAFVLLIFYLAFNLSKEHDMLRLVLVIAGLFIMLAIPGQLHETDRDCGILSNGTYLCFYSNGTQITDFGDNNSIGEDMFRWHVILLRIILTYGIGYVGFKLFKFLNVGEKMARKFKGKFK